MMKKNTYSSSDIKVLEGLEAVKKRPAMYIGDTENKGLHQLLWEVLDNSIDEFLAGYCTNIIVEIKKFNTICIIDNGRGIPIEIHSNKKSALEIVMTVLHSGGKFDNKTYNISGGLHGVGVSCVNALSEYLIVEINRNGKKYQQKYKKGILFSNLKEIEKSNITGTKIIFIPDRDIFKKNIYNYNIISFRLRELSFLNKGIKIKLIDFKNINKKKIQSKFFYSKKGLIEFIDYLDLSKEKILDKPILISKKKENISINIVFNYNKLFSEKIYSYVNNINTIQGGTHVSGFRKALTRTLKNYINKSKLIEKEKLNIIGDDFKEGIIAIVSINLLEPQFEGQTKSKLTNQEVLKTMDNCVNEFLQYFFEENPKSAKKIALKVILTAKTRIATYRAKEIIQKKSVLSTNSLPGKLSDCSKKNPIISEIFIVEGDSAGGTAKQGRDREFQAILPLKGKILNVEKTQEYKIYRNEQIKNIITALGIIFDKENFNSLNIQKLRYYKIIIMTDADIDGSHIRTLILTFFFRYLKELIINNHLYIVSPPLFLINKGQDIIYCWSKFQKESILKLLNNRKNNHSLNIQHYKGLGEMNAIQLWDSTMNPRTRNLKLINIKSAEKANHLFLILMGDDIILRKNFIEKYYKNINF